MTERFTTAVGRKVISRATAEELGRLTHLVVDVGGRRVSTIVVGKGRRARLADWESLSGFGPDAVVLADEAALRSPEAESEKAAARGDLELVGRRALSESGNLAGAIDDVVFDPATGEVVGVVVGPREHPASELRGAGSYAVVLGASVDESAVV
ncbi:MAG: PRC-barrel domain-containing protein [Solirubrobacteraceae bacterium]